MIGALLRLFMYFLPPFQDRLILARGRENIRSPVKAKKYYYFTKPEARKLAEFTLSHNEARDIDRGNWRKYNPYNPYVEDKKGGGQQQDLKIESLDDLFEEDKKEEEQAPVLPQEEIKQETEIKNEEEQQNEVDLQKELEAKFDELFGPVQ